MVSGLIWLDYYQGADSCGHDNEPSVSKNCKKNVVIGQATLKFPNMDSSAWSYLARLFLLSCFTPLFLCIRFMNQFPPSVPR
jgi:hypothetical protein